MMASGSHKHPVQKFLYKVKDTKSNKQLPIYEKRESSCKIKEIHKLFGIFLKLS